MTAHGRRHHYTLDEHPVHLPHGSLPHGSLPMDFMPSLGGPQQVFGNLTSDELKRMAASASSSGMEAYLSNLPSLPQVQGPWFGVC